MSKTEEYLDSLLNNVSPGKKIQEEQNKQQKMKSIFVDDFETQLNNVDMEDFIRDFEFEIDTEDGFEEEKSTEDGFFDNLEDIVKNAKNNSETEQEPPSEDGFEINTLEDDTWTEPQEFEMKSEQEIEKSDLEDLTPDELNLEGLDYEELQIPVEGDEIPIDLEQENRSPEEQELLDMLAAIPTDEELANISQLLDSDGDMGSNHQPVIEAIDESMLEMELAGSSENGKKGKKGFLQKLSTLLFGEDDEEKEQAPVKTPISEDDDIFVGMSDENYQILQELGSAEKPKENAEPPAEDKKKKKKDKKAKKEKKPKEKKAKKEKKPKKPKEIDLSPPLPGKLVFLIFVMGISIIMLVMLASNLLGYYVSISGAKEAFAKEDYVGAYNKIAGLDVKEADEEFSAQMLLLAKVQGMINDGTALYEAKQYKMSLDSYICALGRFDTNYNDAVMYDVKDQYEVLAKQVVELMSEKYNVSAETAREIYGLRNRTEYTIRIYEIIEELGLEE